MGLFDRKRKASEASGQRSAGVESARPVEVGPGNAQAAEIEPTDAQPLVTPFAIEPQLDATFPASGSQPAAAPSAAAPEHPAAILPAPSPQPSDPAANQAMTAPSLENVIVAKSRDLSRLSREDLLQLLLTQSKDAERLQDYLRDVAEEFDRCTSMNARLREKLDVKDEQIERLKGRLDDKDKRITRMQLRLDELEVSREEEQRRARIIMSAAEGVRRALEAFNVTVDWHIASLQEVREEVSKQMSPAPGASKATAANAANTAAAGSVAPTGSAANAANAAPAGSTASVMPAIGVSAASASAVTVASAESAANAASAASAGSAASTANAANDANATPSPEGDNPKAADA